MISHVLARSKETADSIHSCRTPLYFLFSFFSLYFKVGWLVKTAVTRQKSEYLLSEYLFYLRALLPGQKIDSCFPMKSVPGAW